MIPKKIHYFWFGGGEKPKSVQRCINSWKKYCPGWEITEWNETNFDIDANPYTRMCYDEKKFAFLSDYARLVAVYEHGGVYFDTDVELIKSPDKLLEDNAFFGFENDEFVATGLGFGSVPKGEAVGAMLAEYDFLLDAKNGTVGCPILNTRALEKQGLQKNGRQQTVAGAVIYPTDYFNPYNDATGRLNKTGNTVSIHWYSKSWMGKKSIIRSRLSKPYHRVMERFFGKKYQ